MVETELSVKAEEGDKTLTLPSRRGRPRPGHGSSPSPIRRRREAAGLTQAQLAEKAGYSRAHLSMVEDGQHGASPECLAAIAGVLECEIADLMPKRRRATRKPA